MAPGFPLEQLTDLADPVANAQQLDDRHFKGRAIPGDTGLHLAGQVPKLVCAASLLPKRAPVDPWRQSCSADDGGNA